MAVIKVTKGDQLRSKVLEAGWQSLEITSISGMRQNEKKTGFNYDIVFTLVDHPDNDLNGKEFKKTMSTLANGILGQIEDAVNNIAAANKSPEDREIDTDTLIGKRLDGNISVEVYNNRPNNKIEEFAPYKSMKGKGLPF